MANQYVDIGINLTHRQFNPDREEVMKQAEAAGVCPLIITGTSVRTSKSASDYAEKFPGKLYSTAGIHPHDAKGCNDRTIQQLRRLSEKPHVVAIGECGLDYDRDFSPRDVQRKWFEAQIQLAGETGLPLFLHERAAFADFRGILSKYSELCGRTVVHCFTGTRRELDAYLELGCFIGVTGWICDERRGTELRRIVGRIPKEKLLIETDSPFLLPRNLPKRPAENRNEPRYLPHIASEIAACRGEGPEELARYTTQNAKRFFGLGN